MPKQEKLAEWVQIYLKHINNISIDVHVKKEEGYKFIAVDHFQRNFDIEAINLAGMLDASILNNNLVTGSQYWPRKMLLLYAESFPEETISALKWLFDESKNIYDRITKTKEAFDRLNDDRSKQLGESINSYIGLRFLSLLLSYRFPNTCNALKPAEWKVFSRFINPDFGIPQHTPPGEQYRAYEKYIEEVRLYIKDRKDMQAIKKELTKELMFKDDNFRWMTQDVIYVTARIVANDRSSNTKSAIQHDNETQEIDAAVNEDLNSEDNTGFMPMERHLEDYIVKNWDIIDFGEKLFLYRDEDGAPGQQYTTDVGIIDILAKDIKGNFVVIELKRAESEYQVVGQVLNYMGWVEEKLAKRGEKVRGMIVVGKAGDTLISALRPVRDKIVVKEYRVKMNLVDHK